MPSLQNCCEKGTGPRLKKKVAGKRFEVRVSCSVCDGRGVVGPGCELKPQPEIIAFKLACLSCLLLKRMMARIIKIVDRKVLAPKQFERRYIKLCYERPKQC